MLYAIYTRLKTNNTVLTLSVHRVAGVAQVAHSGPTPTMAGVAQVAHSGPTPDYGWCLNSCNEFFLYSVNRKTDFYNTSFSTLYTMYFSFAPRIVNVLVYIAAVLILGRGSKPLSKLLGRCSEPSHS